MLVRTGGALAPHDAIMQSQKKKGPTLLLPEMLERNALQQAGTGRGRADGVDGKGLVAVLLGPLEQLQLHFALGTIDQAPRHAHRVWLTH